MDGFAFQFLRLLFSVRSDSGETSVRLWPVHSTEIGEGAGDWWVSKYLFFSKLAVRRQSFRYRLDPFLFWTGGSPTESRTGGLFGLVDRLGQLVRREPLGGVPGEVTDGPGLKPEDGGRRVLAGLDAGRFGWSSVPPSLQAAGWAGLLFAGAVIWWAASANTFLSRMVRIQDDRGHRVVAEGPYLWIRHPMYAGVIVFILCVPLVLGSCWALVPGVLIGILFVTRTTLEDQTLREELPGYRDYAQRVRYRLIPWVW
jgi:protein-S-isoprenylcysteine O-methyltransferase Ste14